MSSLDLPDYLEIAGENAWMIRLGETASPELALLISAAEKQLLVHFGNHLLEIVPAYTTILVKYNLNTLSLQQSIELIEKALSSIENLPGLADSQLHQIAVCYDKSLGLDLLALAENKQLTVEELIQLHSEPTYHVYAIGFSPAFAYLGNVHPQLVTPRHHTPRVSIPAGSVSIAENQTAIYPSASPGGWQIIGQTPEDFSLKNPDNLTRFHVGDRVKFMPIDLKTFNEMKNDA